MKFITLLRGINLGKRKVLMTDLKKLFELMGFKHVTTLLASGNVVFESEQTDINQLQKMIEEKLLAKFGFNILVILRTDKELRKLVDSDPFGKIKLAKGGQMYVTFVTQKPAGQLKLPYKNSDFEILQATNAQVLSVKYAQSGRTVDIMGLIEKEFGKNLTTRNWNTVIKLANI